MSKARRASSLMRSGDQDGSQVNSTTTAPTPSTAAAASVAATRGDNGWWTVALLKDGDYVGTTAAPCTGALPRGFGDDCFGIVPRGRPRERGRLTEREKDWELEGMNSSAPTHSNRGTQSTTECDWIQNPAEI